MDVNDVSTGDFAIGSWWVDPETWRLYQIVCIANIEGQMPLTIIYEDDEHHHIFAKTLDDFMRKMEKSDGRFDEAAER